MLKYEEPSVEETIGAIVFYGANCEVLKYIKIDKSILFPLCRLIDAIPNQFYRYTHIMYSLLTSIGIDLMNIDDLIVSIVIIDFRELYYFDTDFVSFFDYNDETKSFIKKVDLYDINTAITSITDCLDDCKAKYDQYIALAMSNADIFNTKVDCLRTIKKLLNDTIQVDIPDKIEKGINHA